MNDDVRVAGDEREVQFEWPDAAGLHASGGELRARLKRLLDPTCGPSHGGGNDRDPRCSIVVVFDTTLCIVTLTFTFFNNSTHEFSF